MATKAATASSMSSFAVEDRAAESNLRFIDAVKHGKADRL
jgi:hypothetical protein